MSEYSQSVREVGQIISVSNYRVTVLLDPKIKSQVHSYPHRMAVVTQIGGYLLFPVAPGELVVGIIMGAWENEAMETNESEKEGMLLQFIRNRRTITLNLVGQIKEFQSPEQVQFEQGISIYPNLGTPALLPLEEELVVILEYKDFDCEKKQDTPLVIGESPIYRQKSISASFNNLFSHSFGIIGNTGSGKSWSVASIIQSAMRRQKKILIPNSSY